MTKRIAMALLLCAITVEAKKPDLTTTVKRFFEAHNTKDLNALAETVAPTCVFHFGSMPAMDGAGHNGLLKAYFQAFPDGKISVDEMVVAGDKVISRWTYTGTNQGSFNGMPASNKPVNITGINLDRLENGKIVEHWASGDFLALMQQIGAFPQKH